MLFTVQICCETGKKRQILALAGSMPMQWRKIHPLLLSLRFLPHFLLCFALKAHMDTRDFHALGMANFKKDEWGRPNLGGEILTFFSTSLALFSPLKEPLKEIHGTTCKE